MNRTILTIALAIAFAIPFAGNADAYGERWYMVKQTSSMTANPNDTYGIDFCSLNKGNRIERLSNEKKVGWFSHYYVYVRKVGGPFWCKGWVPLTLIYNMDTVVQDLNYYRNLGNTVPVWQHSGSIWASRDKARAAPPLPKKIQYYINDYNTKIWDGLNHSCTLGIGSIVRITRRIGDTAFIAVDEGPQTGCKGHLPARKISEMERNGQWIHRAPKVCDIRIGTKVHVFEDQFNGAARIKVIDGPCKNREGWILSYTLKR